MIDELVILMVVLCVGLGSSSRLLDDHVYGGVGVEEEVYDEYVEYEDEDYKVTSPDTTAETLYTDTDISTSTLPSQEVTTIQSRPSRVPFYYPNGTLYEDYDCSKYRFQGLSGAPRGGNGPAVIIIGVCLAVAALSDAFRNNSAK